MSTCNVKILNHKNIELTCVTFEFDDALAITNRNKRIIADGIIPALRNVCPDIQTVDIDACIDALEPHSFMPLMASVSCSIYIDNRKYHADISIRNLNRNQVPNILGTISCTYGDTYNSSGVRADAVSNIKDIILRTVGNSIIDSKHKNAVDMLETLKIVDLEEIVTKFRDIYLNISSSSDFFVLNISNTNIEVFVNKY